VHPYDYIVNDPRFDVQLAAATSARSHYKITFPSPGQVHWKGSSTVYGDLFIPQGTGRVPLVIVTHGFGDTSVAPCMTLARLLVRQGIAAFVWYLPIHSQRMPEATEGNSMPETPEEWLGVYRSSVIEIRRFVDWASNHREIDPNRISVAGISMGGIISSIAFAVDTRIHAGIFIVTGGNNAVLSWGGHTIIPGAHRCSQEDCLAAYSKYPDYLDEVAKKGLENVVPSKECFLFDPLTFASSLRTRPILMINGKNDEVVSESSTINFWEACGKPRLIWVEDSHVGTYCQSALLSKEIGSFLGSIS
jgi:poly(3-hydroxybutyrate) depolymerase